MRENVSEARA